LRLPISKAVNKVGTFLINSPVFLLRPAQLKKISRGSYSTPASAEFWGGMEFISQGLFPAEKKIFEMLPQTKGDLLLLGIGGGREALVLGGSGFTITGVDYVKELVEKSVENCRRSGINIEGIVSDIDRMDFPPGRFDVIWYSCSIYSSIPGRKNRINNLRKSAEILKDNGHIACFFYWNPSAARGNLRWKLGKFIAMATFGNTSYQKGDIFKDNLEFLHAFSDKTDLVSEFSGAGFDVIDFVFPENSNNACALLKKKV